MNNAQNVVLELLQKPENQFCADCKSSNPRYVSMQYGIFVCERCAEIHRKDLNEELFSEIKSVVSYNWNHKEAELLERIGNSVSNNYYESKLPTEFSPNSVNTENMTNFIKDKYENRKWAEPNQDPPLDSTLPILLTKLSTALDIGVQFLLLILVIISIIFIFIFKLFKFSNLVKLTTIELTILTEFFSSDFQYPKIGIGFFVEFLYGMIGFGFYKGLILAVIMKMFRKSYSLKKYSGLVFMSAVFLFIYFFGFENILIIFISNFLLIVILFSYFFRFVRGSIGYVITTFARLGKEINRILDEELNSPENQSEHEEDTPFITGRVEEIENENENNDKTDPENLTTF